MATLKPSQARRRIRAAAKVISDAKCGCFKARGYTCVMCEELANAALNAADAETSTS
jgi:hypothetical protein